MSSSLRIIIAGMIAQHPLMGGITWHYLQYLLGLAQLGHQVYYFEDSGKLPYMIGTEAAEGDWVAKNCNYNVGYLAKIMARFGLEDRWAYYCPPESKWFGLSDLQREAIIGSADLLINVSGTLEHPEQYRQIPHLLYIDTDPIVTQIKIASGRAEFIERVKIHDGHFSFGESLSETEFGTDYEWQPTRQPIVLEQWRPDASESGISGSDKSRRESFTTVMSWTSYRPLIHSDRTYGQKDVEFKRFLDLPGRVAPIKMEIALGGTQHKKWQAKDVNLLAEYDSRAIERLSKSPTELLTWAGWRVVDAVEICGDLDSYRHFIELSKAEWSVAKNAYVLGQPGWFSERSACYLAAGRPVVVQDTGFSAALPVGEGILPFRTLPETVAAVREVETNYKFHSEAARAIAEAYFDSDKVLTRLIEKAMSANEHPNQSSRHHKPNNKTVTVIETDESDGLKPTD